MFIVFSHARDGTGSSADICVISAKISPRSEGHTIIFMAVTRSGSEILSIENIDKKRAFYISHNHPVDQPECRFFVYLLVIYVQFVAILFLTDSLWMNGDFFFFPVLQSGFHTSLALCLLDR